MLRTASLLILLPLAALCVGIAGAAVIGGLLQGWHAMAELVAMVGG